MDKHYKLKQSPEYKLWRANIYQRDGWKCKICERKAERIEAHHIYPLRSHYEKRLNIDNGITLCFRCHRLISGKELLFAEWLIGLIKINGVNSVKPQSGNTEPSQERNFLEGVTTRSRSYSIEQFSNKQVKCTGCGKKVMRHYYRRRKGKNYFCTPQCRGKVKWLVAWNKRSPKKRICGFCKKIMKPTPTAPHRIKKFCNNSCHSKYLWMFAGKKMPTYLNGRWAMKYDHCIQCKRNSKKHYGKGMCMDCYNAQYNASNTPTKTLAERHDIV